MDSTYHKCIYCDKDFMRKSCMFPHILFSHPNDPSEYVEEWVAHEATWNKKGGIRTANTGPNECEECTWTFLSQTSLAIHCVRFHPQDIKKLTQMLQRIRLPSANIRKRKQDEVPEPKRQKTPLALDYGGDSHYFTGKPICSPSQIEPPTEAPLQIEPPTEASPIATETVSPLQIEAPAGREVSQYPPPCGIEVVEKLQQITSEVHALFLSSQTRLDMANATIRKLEAENAYLCAANKTLGKENAALVKNMEKKNNQNQKDLKELEHLIKESKALPRVNQLPRVSSSGATATVNSYGFGQHRQPPPQFRRLPGPQQIRPQPQVHELTAADKQFCQNWFLGAGPEEKTTSNMLDHLERHGRALAYVARERAKLSK